MENFNNDALIDLLSGVNKTYNSKEVHDYNYYSKYIGLSVHRSGFYGKQVGNKVIPLELTDFVFNSKEDIVLIVEGRVTLKQAPVNNGIGNLYIKGYGFLVVNDSITYDGRLSTNGDVTKSYVDLNDALTLQAAKDYTDANMGVVGVLPYEDSTYNAGWITGDILEGVVDTMFLLQNGDASQSLIITPPSTSSINGAIFGVKDGSSGTNISGNAVLSGFYGVSGDLQFMKPGETIIFRCFDNTWSVLTRYNKSYSTKKNLSELDDVSFTTLGNKHIPYYDTNVNLWTNLPISGVLGYTPESTSNKVTDLNSPNDEDYPTTNTVKTYVDNAVVGLLNDRGSYNPVSGQYPTTGGSGVGGVPKKGDIWYISANGTINGISVTAGSSVRAIANSPGQTDANWDILDVGLGYVPENLANKITSILGNETNVDRYTSAKAVVDYVTSAISSIPSYSGTPNRITVTGSTIDIASTYAGQTSITTLGTIGTGTWQGTAIADAYIASAATWNGKFNTPTGLTTNFVSKWNGSSFVDSLLLSTSSGVGVNTVSIDASAAFQVDSTTKGVLFPRMDTTQRNAIVSPAQSLLVYDTTINRYFYRHGGGYWQPVGDVDTTTQQIISGNKTFQSLSIDWADLGSSLPNLTGGNARYTSLRSNNASVLSLYSNLGGGVYVTMNSQVGTSWYRQHASGTFLTYPCGTQIGNGTAPIYSSVNPTTGAAYEITITPDTVGSLGSMYCIAIIDANNIVTDLIKVKPSLNPTSYDLNIVSNKLQTSGSNASNVVFRGITGFRGGQTNLAQAFWRYSADLSSAAIGGNAPNALTQLDLQSTTKGLGLNLIAGDLGTTRNGLIWYDTVGNLFKGVQNGSVVNLLSGSGLTTNTIPRANAGALQDSYITEITTAVGGTTNGATRPYPLSATAPSGTSAGLSGYLKWVDNGSNTGELYIYKPYTNGQGAGWYQILTNQNTSFPSLSTSASAIGMGLSTMANSTSTAPTNSFTGEIRNLRVGSTLYGLGVFQSGAGFHYLKPYGGNQWEFTVAINSYMRDWDLEVIGATANSGKGGGNNTLSNISKIGNSTVKFRAMANTNSPYYYIEGVFKVNSSGAITSLVITQPSSNTGAFNASITDTRIQFTGSGFSNAYVICEKIAGQYYGNLYTTPYENERYSADATVKYWVGDLALGSATINARSQLHLQSTSKGFLPNVLTTAQRDAVSWVAGDAGMIIYNSTTNKHQGWNGSTWNDLY